MFYGLDAIVDRDTASILNLSTAFAALALAALALPATAENLCLYGCPAGAPEANRTVTHSIYVLSNDARTKVADWAAYVVSKKTIGKTWVRVCAVTQICQTTKLCRQGSAIILNLPFAPIATTNLR